MASPTTVADEAPEASALESEGTWVVERQRVRRPLGSLFWLAALVVPLGLTVCAALSRTPILERSLHTDAMMALHRAGIAHVRVVVDGRQLLAKVPTGTKPKRVEAMLLAVPGVETVQTVAVYASPAEAKACAHLQSKIDKATGQEHIPFAGGSTQLSATGARMLHAVAQLLGACRPATVVIGGHADSHTPKGPTISLVRARVMERALQAQGIARARMTARGYGDQFPVADGSSAAAQARNQRGSIAVEEQ
ncbi:MAG: OmpA family [Nocardioidaceae bacterium]|nr:OmpA family [Nocardioidaceae bacterium]